MRRFTILSLMGLVLGVAVAITALRNSDDNWAGGSILATALLIGVVTLGAAYHSGQRRAGRLGFVVFCGGYFALAFLGLSDQNLAKLPTTRLLVYVHQRVAPPQTFTFTVTGAGPGQAGQGTILTNNISPGPSANTVIATTTSQFVVAGPVNGNISALEVAAARGGQLRGIQRDRALPVRPAGRPAGDGHRPEEPGEAGTSPGDRPIGGVMNRASRPRPDRPTSDCTRCS